MKTLSSSSAGSGQKLLTTVKGVSSLFARKLSVVHLPILFLCVACSAPNPARDKLREADKLLDAHRPNEAVAAYSEALRLDSGTPAIQDAAYWGRGLANLVLNRNESASLDLRSFVTRHPDDSKANRVYGVVQDRLGHYNEALTYYNKAIQLKPDEGLAYADRCGLYHIVDSPNHYEEAVKDCSEALRLNVREMRVYKDRGNAYKELGDYKKALEDLNEAVRLDVGKTDAVMWRGALYEKMQDLAHALDDYNRVLTFDSQNKWVYAWRSQVFLKMGRLQDALADADHAILLDPSEGHYLNRASIRTAMGNDQGARSDLSQAAIVGAKAK